MALADFIPPGTRITSGPANPSQMQIVQPVANMASVTRTPANTTKSFLDQLQETAGLLSNEIASASNFTPRLASDYITTPFGEPIAQNRFVGNRFEMPNLMGATYNTRGFNPIQGGQFNFNNMGTYNPGAFNQFYQAPMTLPAIATTTTRTGGQGDGRENLDRFRDMQARNALRNEIAKFGFNIPEEEISTLPGLLGLVDTFVSNLDREQRIDDIMRDIDASKPFGVNMFGLGTSYKGSSAIDRSPEDRQTFGPAETKPQGPSFSDSATGKFTGGKQKGSGGFKAGQGPTGGMGGAKKGTERF